MNCRPCPELCHAQAEMPVTLVAAPAQLRDTALTLDGQRAANLAGLAVEEQLTAKGAEVEDRRIGFFEFPVIERELDLADEPAGEGDDDPALLRLAAGLYRTLGVRLDREGLDRAYRDLAGRQAVGLVR